MLYYQSTHLDPGTFVRSHYKTHWYGVVVSCQRKVWRPDEAQAIVRITHSENGKYHGGNRMSMFFDTAYLRIVNPFFIERDVTEDYLFNEHRLQGYAND